MENVKLKYILLLTFCIHMSFLSASKMFKLEDVTPGGKSQEKFIPQDFGQLQWGGDTLLYVKGNSVFSLKPLTQKENELISLDELNQIFKENHLPKQKKIPVFSVPNKPSIINFKLKTELVSIDIKKKKIVSEFKFVKGGKTFDYSKEKNLYAYTVGNALRVGNENDDKEIASDSSEYVFYGQAAHRNEFGIQKGTYWSPKGNYLAFYKVDESQIKDYELIDNSKAPAVPKNIKYPDAGTNGQDVKVGIYSVKTGKIVYLPTGLPTDRYLTCLTWSPDEKEVYLAEVNRAQDSCVLKAYDIKSMVVRDIFTETSATYIEPENPLLFVNESTFIWQSERTGHNHLYLYNTQGNLLKALTAGDWDVLQLNGFNEKTQQLIISTTEDGALNKTIYTLNIETAKRELVSFSEGQHAIQVSNNARFIVDNYSSIIIPRKIDLIDIESGTRINLLSAENPYEKYAMPEVQYGTIKAADGLTDLHYRLTLPVSFDSTKKYPAIVHVYGGPHVQMVQNAWLGGSRGWELYMAQQGFVMFTLDNRGSMNRGQAFEETIYKNIGKAPFDDQMKGVEFLKALSYVDTTRMGVYGWSFGGFMSTQLMCKSPKTFKAGVAGGSVIDWRNYEVMYGERYMQKPQENPDGYAENDLTKVAKDLSGKFMMIHCELDPVVKVVHTEKFLEAAKQAGKDVDFIRYEKHEHNVLGKERPGLFEKISAFFIENL